MKPLRFTKKTYPAPLWKRVAAYLIDTIIISAIILYPFNNYLKNLDTGLISLLKSEMQITAGATFSIMLLTLLYFIIMEMLIKQTIGKMIMKIYVTSTTRELTLAQVILRNITKPFTIILAIDTLYIIIKRTPQRLFDVFSRTLVIEEGVTLR